MLSTGEPMRFDEASVQSQQQILGRILDAHVVLRQLALRRHNLNRAGMRKLRQLAVRPGIFTYPKPTALVSASMFGCVPVMKCQPLAVSGCP